MTLPLSGFFTQSGTPDTSSEFPRAAELNTNAKEKLRGLAISRLSCLNHISVFRAAATSPLAAKAAMEEAENTAGFPQRAMKVPFTNATQLCTRPSLASRA